MTAEELAKICHFEREETPAGSAGVVPKMDGFFHEAKQVESRSNKMEK